MSWVKWALERKVKRLDENFEPVKDGKKLTEAQETVGKVEKQDYYYRNGIEVKNIIKQIYQFFGNDLSSWEAMCFYNIIKYLMRSKYKGNAQVDLDKSIQCIKWLKEEM